jgi:hypothetical protein
LTSAELNNNLTCPRASSSTVKYEDVVALKPG